MAMDAEPAASAMKRFKAYFLPEEVNYMVAQNAGKMPPARVESLRQLACSLMDKIGSRLGFPRRTTATAQVLYHRFHLFFPVKDFAVQDVAVAALLVSSKLEDTLKKLREIQIAAFQVKAAQEGLTTFAEPDAHVLDNDRGRLIGIERLILETISFNFNLRSSAAYPTRHARTPTSQNQDVFAYVIKLGRHMDASKDFIKRAFRMAVDAHRTLLPLSFPPHALAAACLYLTSFFTLEEDDSGCPAFEEGWERKIRCELEDVETICHGILDLLLSIGSSSSNPARTSPSETLVPFQSPQENGSTPLQSRTALTSELTEIKIRLRNNASKRSIESEENGTMDQPRVRRKLNGSIQTSIDEAREKERKLLGRDDVTVRFLWQAGTDV